MSSEFTIPDFSRSSLGGMNLDKCNFVSQTALELVKGWYHFSSRTAISPINCTSTHIATCPIKGVKTLRETRLAVGLLRHRVGYAPVHPTVTSSLVGIRFLYFANLLNIAMGRTRKMSMNRNYNKG